MQIWGLGRAAIPAFNPDYPYVAASDIPLKERPKTEVPRPLTITGMQNIRGVIPQFLTTRCLS